jgi:hypothetical protein
VEAGLMAEAEPRVAQCIRPEADGLRVVLRDKEVLVPWDRLSARLAGATDLQRRDAELAPGGYGVHWPQLDEDLSIGGMLQELPDT